MTDFITKIIGDLESKKEWKEMEARAKALPKEYNEVYEEVKHYVWQGGTGVKDPSTLFKPLVDSLEEGAKAGKHVLEVTGEDVAAFVNSFVEGQKTFEQERREKLNSAIAKKLGKN